MQDVWDKSQIFDRSIRTFSATLGPAGGKRGYAGITGHVSNGLAWYINGFLVPELFLRRGLTYSFKVLKILLDPVFDILKKWFFLGSWWK